MEYMLMPLKKYADFSGRSRRMEYWMFQLFFVLAYIGVSIIAALLASISETLGAIVGFLGVALYLGCLVPLIGLTGAHVLLCCSCLAVWCRALPLPCAACMTPTTAAGGHWFPSPA